MRNCIFTSHCTESVCDKSCPAFVETSYLMERNGLTLNSFVFSDPFIDFSTAMKALEASNGAVGAVVVDGKNYSTVQWSEILTYCAICQNWQGNRLHCSVYNLKFSTYIEELKKSWNSRSDSDKLEYMKIWSQSAKVLIISNFDYVSFKEFESQTLLNLLQSRQDGEHTTILITPPINQLVGDRYNQFMEPMRQRLKDAADRVKGGSKK